MAALEAGAHETWPRIGAEDLHTAVAAGELAHARASADPRDPVATGADEHAVVATVAAAQRAAAAQRLEARHDPGRAPWQRAGVVIPVLGASAGVGVSVVAAALFDALDAAGVPTLLVDAADPGRSGLGSAARNQGAAARTLHPEVGIAYARRGDGWVAQMATPPGAVLSTSVVPAPSWWLPDREAPAVTVVDLGWDSWALATAPLRGPGAWLEAGRPNPRPILVTRATRPGLARANELLSRLAPWVENGHVVSPAALAVVGARRWPRDVPGVAIRGLGPLIEHAAFLPHDPETAVAGVGPHPVPSRLRRAMAPIAARWGLLPPAPDRGTAPHRTRRFTQGI